MFDKFEGDDRKISELTVGELRKIIRETIVSSIPERPYTPYPMCPQPFYYQPPKYPWDDTYKIYCTDHTDVDEKSPLGSLGYKHTKGEENG